MIITRVRSRAIETSKSGNMRNNENHYCSPLECFSSQRCGVYVNFSSYQLHHQAFCFLLTQFNFSPRKTWSNFSSCPYSQRVTIEAQHTFNTTAWKSQHILCNSSTSMQGKANRQAAISQTSYVTVPPDVAGWRRVTLEMAPFADKMQTALGPFWENDIIFADTSWKIKCIKIKFQYCHQLEKWSVKFESW